MTRLEYLWRARSDFIAAGAEAHYACPESHPTGLSFDGRRCVAQQAVKTRGGLGQHVTWLVDTWQDRFGEGMTATNARGYAACVAAYDELCFALTPTTTKSTSNPQKVIAA